MATGTIYDLTHHLNFISDNTGEVEIDEPIGFDAATFVVEQDKDRYGRDVSFANEELDFTFSSIINKFGHHFDKLIEYDKIYGYESEVEYIIKLDGVSYIVGIIDFYKKETDQIKEFKCRFIQDVTQALLKRRYDVKVNVFSNKDLDNEDITPLETTNILLKAKPIVQISEWSMFDTYQYFLFSTDSMNIYTNPYNNVIVNGIENSLSYIDRGFYTFFSSDDSYKFTKRYNMGCIDALTTLSDVTLNLKDIRVSLYIQPGGDIEDLWNAAGYAQLFVYDFRTPTGNTDDSIFTYRNIAAPLMDVEFIGTEFVSFPPQSGLRDRYDLTITDVDISVPNVNNGERISLIFELTRVKTGYIWRSGKQKITAVSTAIDSVVKGIRLVEGMRQTAKSINQDFVLDAPRFDVGGALYDNFIFNGKLIRGFNTEFFLTWKDISNYIMEFNSDYEINGTNLFAGHYSDFYKDVDMGAFLLAPNETFNTTYNELYAVNKMVYKYTTFNQDKDDSNTIDAVHTEAEFLNANKQVENFKEIKIDTIRDPFELETTRKKGIKSKGTTSLSQDDKVFINDCVPLAPSTRGGFTASLTHYINEDDDLQMMNDGSFNWTLLGFNIGSVFTIEDTDNAGTYTVTDYVSNIITLTPITATPTTLEVKLTEVSYPYDNVEYTIRTNEGFTSIENILSPDNYGNLLYTIKRNILNFWGSYLKTASKYKPELILNTFFKNSTADEDGLKIPNLTTQFGSGDLITENANIEQSDLTEMLVTPEVITSAILVDFEENKQLETDIRTLRGFIRIYDNDLRVRKVFLKEKSYELANGVMDIIGEVKFESETLDIIYTDYYTINEVGYNTDLVPELEYKVIDDNIQFFDINTRPLTNKTRYDFVTINGTTYNSVVELTTAIDAL